MKHLLPSLVALLLLASPAGAEESPPPLPEAPAAAAAEAPVEAPVPPPAPPAELDAGEVPAPPATPDGAAVPAPPKPPKVLNVSSASGEVKLDSVAADAFVLSGDAEIGGRIEDALFVFSGDVQIPGEVGGDAYVFAGAVELTGAIEGDLYVFSGDVDLQTGSVVEGRIFAYSGDVVLDGTVEGDVEVKSGNLVIGGLVEGDLDAVAGAVALRPGARIEGDVDYTSGSVMSLGEGAVVLGETTFTQEQVDHDVEVDVDWGSDKKEEGLFSRMVGGIFGGVFFVLMMLVFGAALFWAGGPMARRAVDEAYERPAYQLGLGFALAICVPIASAVACVFILPIPLAVVAMMVLFVAWCAGYLVSATALGRFVLERAGQAGDGPPVPRLLLGVAVLVVVGWVPVLGFFAAVGASLIGLGALFNTWRQVRAEAAA